MYSKTGVFILCLLFVLVVSQRKKFVFESFNTEKDASWFMHNYELLLSKRKEFDFFMNFYEDFDIHYNKGTYECIPNPNQLVDYCEVFQSMNCVSSVLFEKIGFFRCFFTNKLFYTDRSNAIKNCLPISATKQYEECLADRSKYLTMIKNNYVKRNYMEIALLGKRESLIFVEDKLAMKAIQNLGAFFNDTPLEEDSKIYTKDQCDNDFEVENVIKSCRFDKPNVEIFFEVKNPENTKILNELLVMDSKKYGIGRFIDELSFVPYGTTKYNNGTYSCDNEKICQANSLLACTVNIFETNLNVKSERTPLLVELFSCIVSSMQTNPVNTIQECFNQHFDDAVDVYKAVRTCAQDINILDSFRKITELRNVTTFPSVYVNKELLTIHSRDNLFEKICETYISDIRPRLCKQVGRDETTEAQPIEVEIYYNAGMKDSANWLNERLTKLLSGNDNDIRLRRYLNIKYIPWGATEVLEDGTIDCRKSDITANCQASRIVACVERFVPEKFVGARQARIRVSNFLSCFYSTSNWDTQPGNAALNCSDKISNSDIYPWIFQCSQEELKLPIWIQAGKQTTNVVGNFSGFISRVKFGDQLLDSDVDFLNYACALSYNPPPVDCKDLISSSTMLVSSISTFIILSFFFIFN